MRSSKVSSSKVSVRESRSHRNRRADEAATVVAGREVEKPLAGSYTLWVCFSDNSAFDFSSGLEDLTCP